VSELRKLYNKLLTIKNYVAKLFEQLSFYSLYHAFIPTNPNHETEQLSHAISTTTLIFINCMALTLLESTLQFYRSNHVEWL